MFHIQLTVTFNNLLLLCSISTHSSIAVHKLPQTPQIRTLLSLSRLVSSNVIHRKHRSSHPTTSPDPSHAARKPLKEEIPQEEVVQGTDGEVVGLGLALSISCPGVCRSEMSREAHGPGTPWRALSTSECLFLIFFWRELWVKECLVHFFRRRQ